MLLIKALLRLMRLLGILKLCLLFREQLHEPPASWFACLCREKILIMPDV